MVCRQCYMYAVLYLEEVGLDVCLWHLAASGACLWSLCLLVHYCECVHDPGVM